MRVAVQGPSYFIWIYPKSCGRPWSLPAYVQCTRRASCDDVVCREVREPGQEFIILTWAKTKATAFQLPKTWPVSSNHSSYLGKRTCDFRQAVVQECGSFLSQYPLRGGKPNNPPTSRHLFVVKGEATGKPKPLGQAARALRWELRRLPGHQARLAGVSQTVSQPKRFGVAVLLLRQEIRPFFHLHKSGLESIYQPNILEYIAFSCFFSFFSASAAFLFNPSASLFEASNSKVRLASSTQA